MMNHQIRSFIVQKIMHNIEFSEKGNCRFFQLWLSKEKCKKVSQSWGWNINAAMCFSSHPSKRFWTDKQIHRFLKDKKRGQGLEEMCTIIVFTANENSWAAMACRHQTLLSFFLSFLFFFTWFCALSPKLEFQQMRAATTDGRDALRLVMENRCEVLGEAERGWITVKLPPLWSLLILQTDDQTLTSALSQVNINC